MLQTFKTHLLKKEQLASDIWQFTFKLIEPKILEFKAGQYMILKIADKRRLYSIFSQELSTDTFDLLVQMIPNGVGSTYLNDLKETDCPEFQGPAGVFIIKSKDKPKNFLATGTGIAPIYSEICSLLSLFDNERDSFKEELPEINLFWGLRTIKDSYYINRLTQLAEAHKNFKFYLCFSREADESVFKDGYYKPGRITSVILSYFENKLPDSYEYYICGGREVVSSLQEFLQEKNISKENIIAEKF